MHPENENENENDPGTREDLNRTSSGTTQPSDRDSSLGGQCAPDRSCSSDQKKVGDERCADGKDGEEQRSDPHQ